MSWQPIETAPKEPLDSFGRGPRLILSGGFMENGKPFVTVGYWKGVRTNSWMEWALGRYPNPPDAWMHLPEPSK